MASLSLKMNLVFVIVIFVSLNLPSFALAFHKASITVNPELLAEVLNKKSQSLVESESCRLTTTRLKSAVNLLTFPHRAAVLRRI